MRFGLGLDMWLDERPGLNLGAGFILFENALEVTGVHHFKFHQVLGDVLQGRAVRLQDIDDHIMHVIDNPLDFQINLTDRRLTV